VARCCARWAKALSALEAGGRRPRARNQAQSDISICVIRERGVYCRSCSRKDIQIAKGPVARKVVQGLTEFELNYGIIAPEGICDIVAD